jgi:hypothetical protein
MSHRVTVETEIKDKELAIQALKKAGVSYSEGGNTLTITSGPMRHCSIDLTSGRITGDTDQGHTREVLGLLRQNYAEAKWRLEAHREGIEVQQTLQENGNIILMWSKA